MLDIVAGLTRFNGVQSRMQFLKGPNDVTIIDDTYNANLHSVLAAIAVLCKRTGHRVLVLGDLGELGDLTTSHHELIGQQAKIQGVNRLMTCGTYSECSTKVFGGGAQHYATQTELVLDLQSQLNKNTTILVKGSRMAAMEKIIQQIFCN